ncbi:unnamed protein product, partial [Polarella glacialis]
VWCAAWDTDPLLDSAAGATDYRTMIKGKQADCEDNLGNQCGSFYVYDLDDIEDGSADGVSNKAQYDATKWKFNQDVDIIVKNLVEENDYPYIYCYAEDDEAAPNEMIWDAAANAGPRNVHTMGTEIGTVQTLDESPPIFTKLAMCLNELVEPVLRCWRAGLVTNSVAGTHAQVNRLLQEAAGHFSSQDRVSEPGFTGKTPQTMDIVVKLLLEAHKLEPFRVDLLISAANARIYCGHLEAAVAIFKSALLISPEDLDASSYLAIWTLVSGDAEEARRYLSQPFQILFNTLSLMHMFVFQESKRAAVEQVDPFVVLAPQYQQLKLKDSQKLEKPGGSQKHEPQASRTECKAILNVLRSPGLGSRFEDAAEDCSEDDFEYSPLEPSPRLWKSPRQHVAVHLQGRTHHGVAGGQFAAVQHQEHRTLPAIRLAAAVFMGEDANCLE